MRRETLAGWAAPAEPEARPRFVPVTVMEAPAGQLRFAQLEAQLAVKNKLLFAAPSTAACRSRRWPGTACAGE